MANEAHVNAQAHASPEQAKTYAVAAAAAHVWISQTASGPAVNQVKESTPTANHLYWLNVTGEGTAHNNLDFIVRFKAGSPLTLQAQVFNFPGGYGGGITTPFGVPYWGGNPIQGPATLTVTSNGAAVGSVNFTVVP